MTTIILSLGNPIKSDDNIGNLVLDKLKQDIKDNSILFIKAETTPENYFYKLAEAKPDMIYIIDAVDFGGKTGDVRLFDYKDIISLPIITTHNIPITLLSGFAHDAVIKLIAIQPKHVEVGERLSKELKDNFDEIYQNVKKTLKSS